MSDVLLVFALENEARGLFDPWPVLFCGVGKVNAAYRLARKVAVARPRLVLNVGSAGSWRFAAGSVVNCTRFVQRDMDTRCIGTAAYATFGEDHPAVLNHGLRFESFPEATCGTGDSFVTDGAADALWDVVDMESYALAKVCALENIPFGCLKFISDGADGLAAATWEDSLERGARGLREGVVRLLEGFPNEEMGSPPARG